MNSLVFTPLKMEQFFRTLGCRTTIIETLAGPDLDKNSWPMVLVKVPRKDYHFVRSIMAERMAMGTLWDVQVLGFFENRVTKYKFNWEKF